MCLGLTRNKSRWAHTRIGWSRNPWHGNMSPTEEKLRVRVRGSSRKCSCDRKCKQNINGRPSRCTGSAPGVALQTLAEQKTTSLLLHTNPVLKKRPAFLPVNCSRYYSIKIYGDLLKVMNAAGRHEKVLAAPKLCKSLKPQIKPWIQSKSKSITASCWKEPHCLWSFTDALVIKPQKTSIILLNP